MSWLCSKQKTDDDEDEDALYEKLKASSSIIDDVLVAIYEVRLFLPFVVLGTAIVAYHLFIAPYQIEVERPLPQNIELVRLSRLIASTIQTFLISIC